MPEKDIPKQLLKQQELAVQLYIQEDNLNWSKIHHCIYTNSLLFGIMGFLFKDSLTEGLKTPELLVAVIISSFGLVSCGIFRITLQSGIRYIQKRKETLKNIETEIGLKKELRIITVRDEKAEKSPTVKVMSVIPIIIAVLWVITIFSVLP